MPAATHTCEFEGCNWKLETENLEHYISLLKIHVEAMHKQQRVSAKAEKAKRPELASEVSEEDWSYFTSRWEYYKKACGLTAEDTVTQLLECCNEGLRRDHHRTFSGANEVNDENAVLAQLKQIAVSKRNITVNRVKLGTLNQDRGETVRKFAGRVKSLASVSGYTVKCSKTGCNTDIVYQEPVIIDQVIRGLSDSEIQKDVLARDRMDLENLLKYVEGRNLHSPVRASYLETPWPQLITSSAGSIAVDSRVTNAVDSAVDSRVSSAVDMNIMTSALGVEAQPTSAERTARLWTASATRAEKSAIFPRSAAATARPSPRAARGSLSSNPSVPWPPRHPRPPPRTPPGIVHLTIVPCSSTITVEIKIFCTRVLLLKKRQI